MRFTLQLRFHSEAHHSCFKDLSRRLPVQPFTESIIEQFHRPVKFGLAEARETALLGEEAAQQAVGVLVAAPLPAQSAVSNAQDPAALLRL